MIERWFDLWCRSIRTLHLRVMNCIFLLLKTRSIVVNWLWASRVIVSDYSNNFSLAFVMMFSRVSVVVWRVKHLRLSQWEWCRLKSSTISCLQSFLSDKRYVGSKCSAHSELYLSFIFLEKMNSWDEQDLSLWVACSLLLKHMFLSVTHSSRINMRFRSLESCRQCLFDLLLWTYDCSAVLRLAVHQKSELIEKVRFLKSYVCISRSLAVAVIVCYASQFKLESNLLSLLVFILTSFLSLLVLNLTSLLNLLVLNLTSLAKSVLMLLLFRVICKDLSYTDRSCLARVDVFIHLVALTVYLSHSY